jgi:hypothetical protein
MKNKKDDFSPRMARSIAIAELFLERMKKERAIPLRTLRLMERRLASVHRLIAPARKKGSGNAARLDTDIDSALLDIARAKVRREWHLKTKKKVRTYGDSAVHQKKK